MPLEGLGSTCATMSTAGSVFFSVKSGETVDELILWIDRCKSILKLEFLVRVNHHIVLIKSLPFVHTARRFNRLDRPVNYMDLNVLFYFEGVVVSLTV